MAEASWHQALLCKCKGRLAGKIWSLLTLRSLNWKKKKKKKKKAHQLQSISCKLLTLVSAAICLVTTAESIKRFFFSTILPSEAFQNNTVILQSSANSTTVFWSAKTHMLWFYMLLPVRSLKWVITMPTFVSLACSTQRWCNCAGKAPPVSVSESEESSSANLDTVWL